MSPLTLVDDHPPVISRSILLQHPKYVAAIPCENKTLETDTNCTVHRAKLSSYSSVKQVEYY